MNKKVLLLLMAMGSAITQISAIPIQELVDQKRIPKISGPRFRRVLNLSNRNIDSLEGLENIPGIETVHVLRLAYNKIETIPSGVFAKAIKLRGLGLANNGITSIEPNAFAGLKNLRVLVLNANNISSVPEEGLNGMPRLKLLSIGNNPIITSRRFTPELRKQVPTAYIFTLPITKENLKKVGIAAASVVAVALTIAGAYVQKKSVRPGEEGRDMTAEADLLREAKELQNLYTRACKSTTPLSEGDRLELSGQFTLVVSLRDALRETVPVPRINDLVGQVQAYLNSNICETSQPLEPLEDEGADSEESFEIGTVVVRDNGSLAQEKEGFGVPGGQQSTDEISPELNQRNEKELALIKDLKKKIGALGAALRDVSNTYLREGSVSGADKEKLSNLVRELDEQAKEVTQINVATPFLFNNGRELEKVLQDARSLPGQADIYLKVEEPGREFEQQEKDLLGDYYDISRISHAIQLLRKGIAPLTEFKIDKFKFALDAASADNALAPYGDYKTTKEVYDHLMEQWSDENQENKELAQEVRGRLEQYWKFGQR
jgi:hypothetical protein